MVTFLCEATGRGKIVVADLAELKLYRIAELYQEVLDEAARKGSSMLDVLMHHGEAIIIRGDSYRMKDKPSE